jgi:hypothetical protein
MTAARTIRHLFAVAAMALVACGRSDIPLDTGGDGGLPGQLISIAIDPPQATIALQTKTSLVATGLFSDGSKQDVSNVATWTTADKAVASVDTGLVSAVGAGTTTITASYMGLAGSAQVTVTKATVKSIAIDPPSANIAVGGMVQLAAIGLFSDGSKQDVSNVATWTSSSPSVAAVAGGGLVTGKSGGGAGVRATFNGVFGEAKIGVSGKKLLSIEVTPPDPSLAPGVGFKLTAIGHYDDGSIQDLTNFAMWSSSSAMIATVDQSGFCHTVAQGVAVISATVDNVTGTATVTVTAAVLATITIKTPNGVLLPPGGAVQLLAIGTYIGGAMADLTDSVTWSSSDDGIGTVSNAMGTAGVVTGVMPGNFTITATLGNVSGSAALTVSAAKLSKINLTPTDASFPLGAGFQYTAIGAFNDGSFADITQDVAWSTDDPNIATISNMKGTIGFLSTVAAGMTTVRASFGMLTASTTVTVTNAKLLSVDITPANTTLVLGDKQLMTATAHYSDGSSVDITTQVVWTTLDQNVATISNAMGAVGLLAATGPGSTTVIATFGKTTGTTSITVTAPKLSQVVVSPINPSLPVGQMLQFQAVAIFSNNVSLNVTQQAAWSSSSPGIAKVSQTGRGSTLSPGATTITATYMGLSGTTLLTVTNAVLVSVEVTPVNPTLPAGAVQQFQATAIYNDNTSQTVTGQSTWLSSKPGVLGISDANFSKGRATAIAPGSATVSATYQGITGSSSVTVTAATVVSIQVTPSQPTIAKGTPIQFAATAIYSDNSSKAVTAQSTWISTNPQSAQISDANGSKGQALAIAPGTTTISASYMGITGTTLLTVTAATVSQIQITPFSPSLPPGFDVALDAVAIFSDNSTMDVTGLATWLSDAPNVAAVSDQNGSKGHLSPLAAGTAHVTATWMGVTGSDTITVPNAVLVSISVTPAKAVIAVGQSQQFTASGVFSDMSTLDVTDYVTWLSSAPAVADVSNANGTRGNAKAFAQGSTTITAVRGNVSGTASLTVM